MPSVNIDFENIERYANELHNTEQMGTVSGYALVVAKRLVHVKGRVLIFSHFEGVVSSPRRFDDCSIIIQRRFVLVQLREEGAQSNMAMLFALSFWYWWILCGRLYICHKPLLDHNSKKQC